MANFEWYEIENLSQHNDIIGILAKYSSKFNFRNDGTDSLLDIGCGWGYDTYNILLQMLPNNFERLVGADVSQESIEIARSQYSHPKLSFEQFDLDKNLQEQQFKEIEPFTHITSFYCLNFIRHQQIATNNVYKLLKDGGNALLVAYIKCSMYDIYDRQSKNEQWMQYMTDVENHLPVYQHMEDPVDELYRVLQFSAFSDYSVDVTTKGHTFQGVVEAKDFFKECNPFIWNVPPMYHDAYLENVLELSKGCVKDKPDLYGWFSTAAIVHAKK